MWRLNPVAKFACLAEIGAVLKLVSVFPRTFVTVHLLSKLPPFQTLCEPIFKHHWCFISYPNLQEKVRVFAFSISFSLFLVILAAVWLGIVYKILLFVKWVWRVLFDFVLICFHVERSKCDSHCSVICLFLSMNIFC